MRRAIRALNRLADRLLVPVQIGLVNYNDRPDGTTGSALVHGKLYALGELPGHGRIDAHVSWRFGTNHGFGLVLSTGTGDGDDGIGLLVCCPGVFLFFDLEGVLRNQERGAEYGVRVDTEHGVVRVFAGQDPNSWSEERDRWRSFSFRFVDALLGTARTTREVLDDRQVVIPMPEGAYPARAKLERVELRRPRWPGVERFTRVEIDLGGIGIPFPGKGENSYDCDDDATYARTAPAESIEQAIGELVADVLGLRRRRGWPKDSPIVFAPDPRGDVFEIAKPDPLPVHCPPCGTERGVAIPATCPHVAKSEP